MKSLKRIHRTCLYLRIWKEYIGHVYMKSLKEYIGHVYMKSFKRIHRTCLYEEFEENTWDFLYEENT
jgi:hypothetical protein